MEGSLLLSNRLSPRLVIQMLITYGGCLDTLFAMQCWSMCHLFLQNAIKLVYNRMHPLSIALDTAVSYIGILNKSSATRRRLARKASIKYDENWMKHRRQRSEDFLQFSFIEMRNVVIQVYADQLYHFWNVSDGIIPESWFISSSSNVMSCIVSFKNFVGNHVSRMM